MLARPEFLAAQPAVLAQRLDRPLQVLHIGRRLLVDDDEIGQQAARPHIFLEAQCLGDDFEVGDVADPDQEDRKVARDAHRPERRLPAEARRDRAGGKTQERIGIDQVRGKLLHVRGVGEAEPHMPGLHLAIASRPASPGAETLRMVEPADRRLDLGAVRRHDGPEGQRHLLVGAAPCTRRRSDTTGSSVKPDGRQGWRRDRRPPASAMVRPRPMKARRSVSASASRAAPDGSVTKCAAAMSGSLAARLRRGEDGVAVRRDLGLDEHLREGRMRVVRRLGRKHQFGKGGHLDVAVGRSRH